MDMIKQPPQFVKLKEPEKRRTYIYSDGSRLDFHNITAIAISASGTHRLESASGLKFIVVPGWRAIELDMNDWTF